MSTYFKALSCLLAVMTISSCVASMEQEAEVIPNENGLSLEENYDTVTMSAGDFVWETPQTKTTLTDAGAFYWKEDDIVGIIPDEGTQVKFPIDAEEGSQAKTAEFNGGAWALKKNSSYMAYYPFISDMDLDKTQVPVDFSNQCQQGIGTTSHLSSFDFMAASGEMPEHDNINFSFEHLSSLLRLNLIIPKVGEYKTLTLHCDDVPFITGGTVDMTQDTPSITATSWSNDFVVTLSDFSTIEANQTVTIYLLIPPIDMSEQRIHVRLTGDHADCETYYDRPNNKPFLAGHAYSLTMNDMAGGDVIKLIDGESFNAAIKCLANGPGFLYSDKEYSIRHVVFETQDATIPNVPYVDVSDPQSETNIYAWWNSETKTLGIRTSALRVFANEDAHGMFSGLCHLEDIDFTGLDFGYSTNVSVYLNDCYYLTTINGMSAWGSASNVENYSGMFKGCKQLASVDISQINTSSCIDISSMFEHCEAMKSVDLSTFDTTHLEQMHSLFSWCTDLESVEFGSDFDCSKVADFSALFLSCSSLPSIDITGLCLDNANSFFRMFEGCSQLTTINRAIPVDYGDSFSRIFMGCGSLTNESLAQAITGWDVSGSAGFNGVFYGSTVTELDLHTWNVQRATDFSSLFEGCSNLSNLNITGWQTDNVTNLSRMFFGCSSLQSLDLSTFVTDNVESFEYMFGNCSSLQTLTLTGWDTGEGINFEGVFSGCSVLESLNVKHFDVSKATNLSWMFKGCSSLTTLDISGYNTSAVTNMSSMFEGCSLLASIDLTGMDVGIVRDMGSMFGGCEKLETIIGISALNPVFCSIFLSMFANCSSLTSLDLSAWNTSQAERMDRMFSECNSLSTLDISGFNTTHLSNDKELEDFVNGCFKLETFKTGDNFAFKGFKNYRMSTEVDSCTIYCTPEFKQAWLDSNLDDSKIVWMNCSTLEPM